MSQVAFHHMVVVPVYLLIKVFNFLSDIISTIFTVIVSISLLLTFESDFEVKCFMNISRNSTSFTVTPYLMVTCITWEFVKRVSDDTKIICVSEKSVTLKVKLIYFKTNMKFSKFFLILQIIKYKLEN